MPEAEGVTSDSLQLDWEHGVNASKLTTPIVSENRVFVASQSPKTHIVALGLQRGNTLWERERELLTHTTPSFSNGLNIWMSYMSDQRFESIDEDSSINAQFDGEGSKVDYLLSTDEVLIAGMSGRRPELRAYNRGTNKLCWRVPLEEVHFEISGIAVDEDTIFTGVKGMETDYPDFGEIFAVDADEKQIKWAFAVDAPVHSVSVKNKDVICLTDSAVVNLDKQTGEENWQVPVSCGTSSCPAVSNDVIVFGDVYNVRAVERSSGKEMWKTDLSGTNAKPTLCGDRVYVSHGRPKTDTGKITMLNKHSGTKVAEVETGEERLSRPIVASNSILASSRSGRILKYEGGD